MDFAHIYDLISCNGSMDYCLNYHLTLIKPSPPWVDFVECPPRIVGHENRPWRLVDQLFTCRSCVGYENCRPDARLPVNENSFSFIGLLQLWETRYKYSTVCSVIVWGKSTFLGEIKHFFGYGIVTIEMFEKKMFQIMCHIMGCNHSSGKHGHRGGGAFALT